jgi:uncharacterized protein YqjF (DUF2071 family)
MASMLGPPSLTDSDVDALARQFLNSAYADDTYADWPLDRRLDGFLRRRGLARLAEDGDAYDLVLNRVMAYIRARTQTNGPHARDFGPYRRISADWSDGHRQHHKS